MEKREGNMMPEVGRREEEEREVMVMVKIIIKKDGQERTVEL